MLNLPPLKGIFQRLTARAVADPFYNVFNSTAANLVTSVARVGTQFTVTVVCEACTKAHRPSGVFNAADANLATAFNFALTQYGAHCAKGHK